MGELIGFIIMFLLIGLALTIMVIGTKIGIEFMVMVWKVLFTDEYDNDRDG